MSSWTHRNPAGITVTGRELRLLSRADCAAGLQLMQFALDRDGVEVTLEASFAMAGLGMEPTQLDEDLGAWRTEGTGKGVAMAGAVESGPSLNSARTGSQGGSVRRRAWLPVDREPTKEQAFGCRPSPFGG